jgi:hypothetical protein
VNYDESEDFSAIRDGFLEMLINKYPGLTYETHDGGFTFKDREIEDVGVTFYVRKMLVSNSNTAMYFDYSDPECFDRAIDFCGSMKPLNVARGFQIES